MASCIKCGAILIAQARFCATCGSPVTRASVAPAVPSPKNATGSSTDPFAKTILRDDSIPALAALAPPPSPASPTRDAPAPPAVSPMAASLMSSKSQPPPQPPPGATPGPAYAAQPNPWAPAGPTQFAPPVPQQTHSFAPGTLVLVYWANGQRYPGTVLQVSSHHVFVAFPNGMQQWVDARYVTVGS